MYNEWDIRMTHDFKVGCKTVKDMVAFLSVRRSGLKSKSAMHNQPSVEIFLFKTYLME